MALHADSIPTSQQVRETLLDRFYYPYQKQIWVAGVLLAVAILGVLASREYRQRRLDDQWTRFQAALEAGDASPDAGSQDARRRIADARIALLRRLVTDYPDAPVTPYALHAIVSAQVEAERYDDALSALRELRAFRNFPLNTEAGDVGASGQARSLADRMEAQIADEQKWATETEYVHPKPSASAMALVETTSGSFWLGFYEDQAPQHVENFKKLAKSGYFNGTQVYDVRAGGTPETPTPVRFEAGSAASSFRGPEANPNPGSHARDEPGALIEPEDSRYTIRHLRGVVSSVTVASGESSRRFMVVGAEKGLQQYDSQNTPFAMVLDRDGSLATVDRICRAPTYATDPVTKTDPERFSMLNHPYPPIWIRRVTIWKDEKLEDGHAWSTERRSTTEPEPWEKELPPPPKPSDFAPKKATIPETPAPGEPTPGDEKPK